MTMLISELLGILEQSSLTDIYVPGFIDDGTGSATKKYLPQGGRQFHPMSDNVYLQFVDRLLRCRAPEQHSRMSVVPVEQIECGFEIDLDDTFGVTSVFRLARQSGGDSARVLRLDVFLGEGCDLEHCVFAALGLLLDGEDYLFLDPLDFDGIRIGSDRMREAWVSYWGDKCSVKSYSVGSTRA
jgi:hypothetical protein